MSSHYETLGVSRDADADTIKKAYRKLSREHHPDKGGDADTMAKINDAYAVLGDPERRKDYDEKGIDTRPPPINDRAHREVFQMFDDWISGPMTTDPVKHIIRATTKGLEKHEQQLKEAEADLAKMKSIYGKVITKDGSQSIYNDAVENGVQVIERFIDDCRGHILLGEEILRIMANYEYVGEVSDALEGAFINIGGVRYQVFD